MRNMYLPRCAKTTKLPKTRPANSTWASISNRTKKNALSICPCQSTCLKHYTNFNIQRRIARSMHLTTGQNPPSLRPTTAICEPYDDSAPLDQDGINRVQQVVGTFLYYARAIDSTAMVAINSISGEQAKATENTAKKVIRLLNYFATHPDVTLRYTKSGMVLKFHTNLVEPRARGRHGAHNWLGTTPVFSMMRRTVQTVVVNDMGSLPSSANARQSWTTTTVPSKATPASSNLLYPPLPKLKRRDVSTIVLMQFQFASHSKKWGTPNHLHQ